MIMDEIHAYVDFMIMDSPKEKKFDFGVLNSTCKAIYHHVGNYN